MTDTVKICYKVRDTQIKVKCPITEATKISKSIIKFIDGSTKRPVEEDEQVPFGISRRSVGKVQKLDEDLWEFEKDAISIPKKELDKLMRAACPRGPTEVKPPTVATHYDPDDCLSPEQREELREYHEKEKVVVIAEEEKKFE